MRRIIEKTVTVWGIGNVAFILGMPVYGIVNASLLRELETALYYGGASCFMWIVALLTHAVLSTPKHWKY